MNRNQVRKGIVDALVNYSVYLAFFNSGLQSQFRYGSSKYSPESTFISIASGSDDFYVRNGIQKPILIHKYQKHYEKA